MTNFRLGKIQQMWVLNLYKYPERKNRNSLGHRYNPDIKIPYRACCLGELHLCAHRIHKKRLPFDDYSEMIVDIGTLGNNNKHMAKSTLKHSYKKYGLRSEQGDFNIELSRKYGFKPDPNSIYSLIMYYCREADEIYPAQTYKYDVWLSIGSLTDLNDHDEKISWKAIGYFISHYPEIVFNKSV